MLHVVPDDIRSNVATAASVSECAAANLCINKLVVGTISTVSSQVRLVAGVCAVAPRWRIRARVSAHVVMYRMGGVGGWLLAAAGLGN